MIIEISDVLHEEKDYTGEEPSAILALEEESSASLRLEEPIKYSLRAYLAGSDLIVNGKLCIRVIFRCSRCSEFFPLEIKEGAFQGVYEVADNTESVDLTPDIRETILLNFPGYPVCGEHCKGLCSHCGTNLNEGSCDCQPPSDPRWSALENMGNPE